MVERIVPPRSHEHAEDAGDHGGSGEGGESRPAADAAPAGEGSTARPTLAPGHVRMTGRTRQHKLVHLVGPADLVGQFVTVHVDHAGPYALRGTWSAS
jgi:hypothetical protein